MKTLLGSMMQRLFYVISRGDKLTTILIEKL